MLYSLLFKNNLRIKTLPFNNNNIKINKHLEWEKSIILYHENSIYESNLFDLFFALKSYSDDLNGFVNSIYAILSFPLKNNQSKTVFLEKLDINKLKVIKSEYEFYDWWNKTMLKLWHYEIEGRKVRFLINIDINNISKKFELNNLNLCYNLQPIFPWNNKILKILKENEDFKIRMSNLIKKQSKTINLYKICILIILTILFLAWVI